jgi:hypothetical protein
LLNGLLLLLKEAGVRLGDVVGVILTAPQRYP